MIQIIDCKKIFVFTDQPTTNLNYPGFNVEDQHTRLRWTHKTDKRPSTQRMGRQMMQLSVHTPLVFLENNTSLVDIKQVDIFI